MPACPVPAAAAAALLCPAMMMLLLPLLLLASPTPAVAALNTSTPCAPASSPGVASCGDDERPPASAGFGKQGLDAAALRRVRAEHLLYDYCEDQNRFKDEGLPKECTAN